MLTYDHFESKESIILEPEDWSEAEWATICKLFDVKKDRTEQIILEKGYNLKICERTSLTLRHLLHDIANTGDFVNIVDHGWTVACAFIDSEDLFINCFSNRFLDKVVANYHYADGEYQFSGGRVTIPKTLIVDLE